MDTERFQRVMERVYGGKKPEPGENSERERLTRCLTACRRTIDIMSTLSDRSPVCGRMLRPAVVSARRREREMQTEYYLRYGDVLSAGRSPLSQTGTLRLLREGCLAAKEEADAYARAADGSAREASERWRLYEAQARTAEKLCRTLLEQAMGKE